MNQTYKLIRTFVILSFILGILRIFFVKQPVESQTKKIDPVIVLYEFHQNSGYTNEREYKRDIEQLLREKQALLDTLLYKETIQFYSSGTYSNTILESTRNRFEIIDRVIAIAQDKLKLIEVPDFVEIGVKKVDSPDFSSLLE